MREKTQRAVVTFYTTAEAMATEKLCKAKQLDGKLISAPRAITSDCGIAWSAPIALRETLREELSAAGIVADGFYELTI